MAEPRRRHIQEECAKCGAKPSQRCRTKAGMEARYFHTVSLAVDPAPIIDADGRPAVVYTEPKTPPKPELKTPPGVDPEVEELEAAIYHRGLDTMLATSLARTLDTGRVQPLFKQGNKKKTDARRAKNRVARKSRKRNRR